MGASEFKGSVLELLEMAPASLDGAAVERLFADLAFETTVLAVALRALDSELHRGEGEHGGQAGDAPSLRVARDALLSGRISGVQLRYVHGGVEWWDTLMRTQTGFRVVRVRKAKGPAP